MKHIFTWKELAPEQRAQMRAARVTTSQELEEGAPGAETSHGICDACVAKFLQEAASESTPKPTCDFCGAALDFTPIARTLFMPVCSDCLTRLYLEDHEAFPEPANSPRSHEGTKRDPA
jgi:hypothetical protein